MKAPLEVWFDHEVVGTHPSTSEVQVVADDSGQGLLVTEPDGKSHHYPGGAWHAAAVRAVCGYADPRDDCPRCHPEPATTA